MSETDYKETQQIDAANQHKLGPYLSKVPRDVLMEILSHIPVTVLKRWRSEFNDWQGLLLDPEFAKIHFSRVSSCILFHPNTGRLEDMGSIDLKEGCVSKFSPVGSISSWSYYRYQLLGSCNGLVLFQKWERMWSNNRSFKPLYVSNPLTEESEALPRDSEFQVYGSVYGFGFSPKTKQYKVIRIFSRSANSLETWNANIWIFGKRKWKSLGEIPYKFDRNQYPCSYTYLDGLLHWLAVSSSLFGPKLICSFDLETEQFQSLPLPPGRQENTISIGALGGRLCALFCTSNSSHLEIEIWVMKDYGIRKSWVKEHVFTRPMEVSVNIQNLKLIRAMDNGEILFSMYSYLFCYSPRDGSCRQLEDLKVSSMASVVAYFPSFISLYDVATFENCKWVLINGKSKEDL